MARIIGGSPLGMLSGKMGGLIFSHNKSGQYVRQYVSVTNPNTQAQSDARSKLGAASQGFHGLTPAQKSAWGVFAQSHFNPRRGYNEGQYSGFQAFTSLLTSVYNTTLRGTEPTLKINDSEPSVEATFADFAFSNDPPTAGLQANIAEQLTNNPLGLRLHDITIYDDGSGSAIVKVGETGTAGHDIEDFEDTAGNEFGFAVYISNAMAQDGLFVNNPGMINLCYLEHPELDSADRSGVTDFELSWNAQINEGDYQAFPDAGETIRAELYSISRGGQVSCIGAQTTGMDSMA